MKKPMKSYFKAFSQLDLCSGMWYLDTGENGHMIGKKALFYELHETYKAKVIFGVNSRIFIKGKTIILLNSWDNSHITLKNVLYTPSLQPNIFNLRRLDEEGCNIHSFVGMAFSRFMIRRVCFYQKFKEIQLEFTC